MNLKALCNFLIFLSSVSAEIHCNYEKPCENHGYKCDLKIKNPEGRDNYIAIDGEHRFGSADLDVVIVEAESQKTLNVPSIICWQFPNVQQLVFRDSLVQKINENSFENCGQLDELDLSENGITVVPDVTFRNSPKLKRLTLYRNKIASIEPDAFDGLNELEVLVLEGNLLTELNPQWFVGIGRSLTHLLLSSNKIQNLTNQLGFNPFENLGNLRVLDLGNNIGMQIFMSQFVHLASLENLYLDGCDINGLYRFQLNGLSQLKMINLRRNSLDNLLAGTFENFTNLEYIDMSNNHLKSINSDIFGDSLPALTHVNIDNNPIVSIDRRFIDQATNLSTLSILNTSCTDHHFTNVASDLPTVHSKLAECFKNFNEINRIQCSSFDSEPATCALWITNPSGHDSYDRIEFLVKNKTYSDILKLLVVGPAETRIVPRILCDQLTQLEDIKFRSTSTQVLTAEAFAGCQNLKSVTFEINPIQSLPRRLFGSSSKLESFSLREGFLFQIADDAFAGTSLKVLSLGEASLKSLSSKTFAGIGPTLKEFRLVQSNAIDEFSEGTFDALVNLEILDVSFTQAVHYPPTAFRGLKNLRELDMSFSGLPVHFRPEWFASLGRLKTLRLSSSSIESLPRNVLAPLQALTELIIDRSQLHFLHSNIFGENIRTVQVIDASDSHIQAIDPELFDKAQNLREFLVSRNLCVDGRFDLRRETREAVRQQLEPCFGKFRGSAECRYDDEPGEGYTCRFYVSNVAGHDDFKEIGGSHITEFANSSVKVLRSSSQVTRSMPSVICRQFQRIQRIFMINSLIQEINVRNCINLRELNLQSNHVTSIGPDTFRNNPNLEVLYLLVNRITTIAANTFFNTKLVSLNLGSNQIVSLNHGWANGVTQSLQDLRIFNAKLLEITDSTFAGLVSLQNLDIGFNAGLKVSTNAFAELTSLKLLSLDECRLRGINRQWFAALKTLESLILQGNHLTELPANSLSAVKLKTLWIPGNRIRELHVEAFGQSLDTLERINANNNQINVIDEAILDQGSELNVLNMTGNICVNENFINVSQNQESVKGALGQCFRNPNFKIRKILR